MGRAMAGGERADSLIMGEGRVADKRGLLARRDWCVGSGRQRGEGSVAWGAGGSERWAELAVRGARERERGGGGTWAGIGPTGGRREIPFPFSFPISKSILLSPFL
jgi:hypothetical protein